jgi:hypothetical protein
VDLDALASNIAFSIMLLEGSNVDDSLDGQGGQPLLVIASMDEI